MDTEEYSLLKQTNIEQGKKIEALEQAIKKMAEPAGPRHVSKADLENGRVLVDPRDVAEGRVLIDFPEPEEKEPRTLKPNEILKTDAAKISANLAKIASGEMILVD